MRRMYTRADRDFLGITLMICGVTVLTMGGIFGMTAWFSDIDAERAMAAQAYEACVAREYHSTPHKWFSEHGEFPECEG